MTLSCNVLLASTLDHSDLSDVPCFWRHKQALEHTSQGSCKMSCILGPCGTYLYFIVRIDLGFEEEDDWGEGTLSSDHLRRTCHHVTSHRGETS